MCLHFGIQDLRLDQRSHIHDHAAVVSGMACLSQLNAMASLGLKKKVLQILKSLKRRFKRHTQKALKRHDTHKACARPARAQELVLSTPKGLES